MSQEREYEGWIQERARSVADSLCAQVGQQLAGAAACLDNCSDSQLMCSQLGATQGSPAVQDEGQHCQVAFLCL
jgi:hypothetical protein